MKTKEVVKLIEGERLAFKAVQEMKAITRGEHHLVKLFLLSLDKIQVRIEG